MLLPPASQRYKTSDFYAIMFVADVAAVLWHCFPVVLLRLFLNTTSLVNVEGIDQWNRHMITIIIITIIFVNINNLLRSETVVKITARRLCDTRSCSARNITSIFALSTYLVAVSFHMCYNARQLAKHDRNVDSKKKRNITYLHVLDEQSLKRLTRIRNRKLI